MAGHDINFNLSKGGKVTAYGSDCDISTMSPKTITKAENNVITTPEKGTIYIDESQAYIAQSDGETPATYAVVKYIGDDDPVGPVAPIKGKTSVQDKSPQTGDGDNKPLYVLLGLSAAVAGTVCYRKSQNASIILLGLS